MAKSATKTTEAYDNAQSNPDEVESVLEYSVNIEDQERPPLLPVGPYTATLTGIEKKYGKESQRPYLNCKWTVEPDSLPAEYSESTGGTRKTLFMMLMGAEDNPQARFNMKQFCQALGAPMGNRINLQDLLNRQARIEVTHGKDLNGQPQEQVRRVLAS